MTHDPLSLRPPEKDDRSMKIITIHRKWQFANAWMPHWVVLGISWADFMEKFHLPDAHSCEIDALGYIIKDTKENYTIIKK